MINVLLTKKCSKCNNEKPINNFWKNKHSKDGYDNQCIICTKEVQKRCYLKNFEKYKFKKEQWTINNPDKVKAAKIKWQKNNPDKVREMIKIWKENNPDKIKERNQKYRLKYRIEHPKKVKLPDPVKIKEQRKISFQKRMAIPAYKLSKNFSRAIRDSLKGNKSGYHWETLVGYSLQDLKNHLEKLFKKGMSWANQGKWHIDHKIPLSLWKFDNYSDSEFKQCWALCNLQPLWEIENISKGNRI